MKIQPICLSSDRNLVGLNITAETTEGGIHAWEPLGIPFGPGFKEFKLIAKPALDLSSHLTTHSEPYWVELARIGRRSTSYFYPESGMHDLRVYSSHGNYRVVEPVQTIAA